MFPDTPSTLLTRLSAHIDGSDESDWTRFFDLYQPAMVKFVSARCNALAVDADDVVQNVLMRLVKILRDGRYDKSRGRFHAFLAVTLRNELFSEIRHLTARPEFGGPSIDTLRASDPNACVPSTTDAQLDLAWRLARHEAVVDHILTHTALSAQSKSVFRELETTGDTCEDVARRLGLAPATVRQIKSRVSRMVAALETRLCLEPDQRPMN